MDLITKLDSQTMPILGKNSKFVDIMFCLTTGCETWSYREKLIIETYHVHYIFYVKLQNKVIIGSTKLITYLDRDFPPIWTPITLKYQISKQFAIAWNREAKESKSKVDKKTDNDMPRNKTKIDQYINNIIQSHHRKRKT